MARYIFVFVIVVCFGLISRGDVVEIIKPSIENLHPLLNYSPPGLSRSYEIHPAVKEITISNQRSKKSPLLSLSYAKQDVVLTQNKYKPTKQPTTSETKQLASLHEERETDSKQEGTFEDDKLIRINASELSDAFDQISELPSTLVEITAPKTILSEDGYHYSIPLSFGIINK